MIIIKNKQQLTSVLQKWGFSGNSDTIDHPFPETIGHLNRGVCDGGTDA